MSEPAHRVPVVGIDLGTKNSCIGFWRAEDNTVEILTNDYGYTTTPSSIAYIGNSPDDMKIVVGSSAQLNDNWIYDAKRMIGLKITDESVQEFMKNWPFEVVQGSEQNCEISIPNLGKFKVEEVSSHVLGYLKQIAEKKTGLEVRNAVITVPAYFTNQQKQATEQAARIAGLNVLRLINEPTAAAMAAGFHKIDEEKNVLVFDFGGGTFDISIICIGHGILNV